MTSSSPLEYLLVGTVTKDVEFESGFTIGGTVTYAATVVKNMGWRPIIITRAATDFVPPKHLSDVTWLIIPTDETTTYRNDYYPTGRIQTIGPIAEGIMTGVDIPSDYQQPAIVHLCPLAQDVDPEVTTVFSNTLLTATPQGWLRQWDEQGIVSLGTPQKMEKALSCIQMAVISIEDVEGDWSIVEGMAQKIETLVVTEGENGCTVFNGNKRVSVPPRPARPIDPTGAGDVFAAVFFIHFHETKNLEVSARYANVAASMSIERRGVEQMPTRVEIEDYLAL